MPGHPLTSSHPEGVESGGPPSGRRGSLPSAMEEQHALAARLAVDV
jgi:hypothetical protein